MTEKEKLLGLEIAKLQTKIHRQRLALSEKAAGLHFLVELKEVQHRLAAETFALKHQIAQLQTENRALRIYIAERKIPSRVRLWLGL